MNRVSPRRRRLLGGLMGGSLLATLPLRARAADAPRPLVVLTAYPDEVVARMEAAFARHSPQWRLHIVWRMPHDALPYLQQAGNSGVDVYWSASPRTYQRLAREGVFQPLGIELDGLPPRIGATALRDPDQLYQATEMAGYGFALQPEALASLGVPRPKDWRDLADPRLAGRIALPIPARVGFAPVMVDIVLQAYGWDEGWALWSAIADQARLIDRGATFVSDEVASGRCAVGLSIDFFVVSAIANGAKLDFAYPAHGGINPAHVAITAHAPNPEGARDFARFILSEEAQRLLTHPDIRKLPVRPAVYAGLPADYHRPFEAATHGAYDYDNGAGRSRLALVAALFQQMLVERHDARVALRQRLHKLPADSAAARQLSVLLSRPPVSAREAADPALQALFRDRLEGADSPAGSREKAWLEATDQALAQAEDLLRQAGA